MNLQRLREILRLSSTPEWAMRNPDPEEIAAPEPIVPKGTNPAQPGTPMPQKPKGINPAALSKTVDQMLLGKDAANQETTPEATSPQSTLSQNLRMRLASRKITPQLPGKITGGSYGV